MFFKTKEIHKSVLFDMRLDSTGYTFSSSIMSALERARCERDELSDQLDEDIKTLKKLTPECDKTDYILSACCGILAGIMDIFLVGKPGKSLFGNSTDKWFNDRTMDFAKMCGWDSNNGESLSSAMRFLEKKFQIPYDQRGAGDSGMKIFGLSPHNHHFKSLGHNPTLCGLFFSILDQFQNTSHFLSNGQLISLERADESFVLQGHNTSSKLYCGFMNWFGHLISDVSGSSSSKGRGMGIPSPFWSWTNDIIAIKEKAGLSPSEFDQTLNELALKIYEESYDIRFQTAQCIPVFVNEILVRAIYAIRRLLSYFVKTKKKDRSVSTMWASCKPFDNATIKRMLTVAHGTFCLVDVSDAAIHGLGTFNVSEFFLRLNIPGIGRFVISLSGEASRGLKQSKLKDEIVDIRRKRIIVEDYIEGLNYLARIYDDAQLVNFTEDLKKDQYIQAFDKSIALAKMRHVPDNKILRSLSDINKYFNGEES